MKDEKPLKPALPQKLRKDLTPGGRVAAARLVVQGNRLAGRATSAEILAIAEGTSGDATTTRAS